MAYKSSVNLGLDNIADPPDPSFFGIFTRVYNAIRNLAIALDFYTGRDDPDQNLFPQIPPSSSISTQRISRLYCIFGVTITPGQTVSLYNDSGVLKGQLASAASAATPMHGWCQTGANAGEWGEVILGGLCELIGGLTPGAAYYLGDTPGTIAPTVGTVSQYVGFAVGSSAIYLDLDAVSAGGGGTSVTLTGDVTGSGTGTFSTTISPDTVTFAKMQNVSSGILLGRGTAGSGDVEEITLGTNLSLSGTTLNASGGGGSVSFTAATITVTTRNTQYAEVTVVDAAITALSKISIGWGNFTDADENTPDMDSVQFHAIPAAGSMAVRLSTGDFHSRIGGTYKINYLIG